MWEHCLIAQSRREKRICDMRGTFRRAIRFSRQLCSTELARGNRFDVDNHRHASTHHRGVKDDDVIEFVSIRRTIGLLHRAIAPEMHGELDFAFKRVSISTAAVEAKRICTLQGIWSGAAHVIPVDRSAENRGEGSPADRLQSLDDSRLPHRMPRRIDLQRDAWIGRVLEIFSQLNTQLQAGFIVSWLSYSEP
jgi:hypothetical protein